MYRPKRWTLNEKQKMSVLMYEKEFGNDGYSAGENERKWNRTVCGRVERRNYGKIVERISELRVQGNREI